MPLDQNQLNALFGDDWGKDLEGDLEMDDSGELAFTDDSEKPEDSNDLNEGESEETDAEDSEDDSEASDGEEDSESGDSDADPVESRFQSLESSVDKLTGLLEQIAHKLGQQPAKQEELEDEDDDDVPLTKKELRKMMKETVNEAVKPFNQQTQEQKEAAVVKNLIDTYGKDFQEAVPAMKKILTSNPALGIQGAWDLVSEIKGIKKPVTPKATKQDSGSRKELPKKKGDAATLRDKAANLNTAKGVSGSGKDKKRAVGIDDVLKQSWDEVFDKRG